MPKRHAVTIAELIILLKKKDSNSVVLLARDEEGNGYGPVGSIEEVGYSPTTEDVVSLDDRDNYAGDTIPAVVLYPGY